MIVILIASNSSHTTKALGTVTKTAQPYLTKPETAALVWWVPSQAADPSSLSKKV